MKWFHVTKVVSSFRGRWWYGPEITVQTNWNVYQLWYPADRLPGSWVCTWGLSSEYARDRGRELVFPKRWQAMEFIRNETERHAALDAEQRLGGRSW